MDLGSHNNSYLAPGSHLQSRRASVSTAFTDTMSNNMRRELSQSSHVTDSSRTASDIHSNIGDSIVAFPPLIPQYIQGETETFHWSRPQIEVGDQSTFNATDHRLLPPETPLPQPTPGINDPLSNIEASINDPNALFELVIDRLRQEYATHPNQTTYALSLAQTHLGTNAIRRLITPRVQLLRTPQVSSTPSIIGRRASNTTQQRYLCKLCPTPVGITTKGAFRRHVNDKHQAKSLFLCMRCEWSSTRKDKLRNHLRVRHPNDSGQDLTERELVMPEPSHCVLCETDRLMNHSPPFLSWDAWFVGVEAHCRVDENPENEMKRETDTPPDQEDGTRGAGGFLFPTLSFTRGSSAGSTSFSQGSNLAPDSTFSGWTFNGPPTHGLGDNKNKDRKQHVIRHLSDGECLKLTDISENMSALSLYDRPSKPRASSSSDVAADRNSSKILSISDLIQQLDIATLVFSINKISLVLTEKLQVIKFEDSTKISFDPLIFGEKTLYRIHCDHPVFHRALSRHLSRCSTSLNAIQRELSSVSTIPTPATKSKEQCHRRKRLSSLWARLRAVSFVLSLQKEVAIDEGYAPHPRNAKDKLISNKTGLSKATMSPFTSEALKYLYKLAQKHLPLDSGGGIFDDDKTNSLKSYSRSPNVDSSLGVFGFLQGLTAVISNPKPSVVESYDTTDLYGLLHRSMTNLSTTSF